MKRLRRLLLPGALALGLTVIALVSAGLSAQHALAGTTATEGQPDVPSAVTGRDHLLAPTFFARLAPAGVSLEPPHSALAAEPGAVVTHSHLLLNLGALTDTFDLEWASSAGWSSLLPTTPITLGPAASTTIHLIVTVPLTAPIGGVDLSPITATSRLDPSAQATAVDATTVLDQETPWTDLGLAKGADRTEIEPGEGVRFSLVITNAGPLTANLPVTLSDVLTPPDAVQSWLLPPECSGELELGLITCAPVIPAESAMITLTLIITTSETYTGLLVNEATVSSDIIDPNPFNNVARAVVQVGMPALQTFTYLPLIPRLVPPLVGPSLPPPIHLSGTAPLDFDAIRADLQAQGKELAFAKIGFHAGLELTTALTASLQHLDAAGVPFFLKTAINAEPVFIAQELMKVSGVPHTLVYRRSDAYMGEGYDTPIYDLDPDVAAQLHWDRHIQVFPPELDPSLVWLETINEVDKDQSEWLAQFAIKTAELALNEGRRWAAFGWSSGEPELEHWTGPHMLQFLLLAGRHPDRLAIALHEYSYEASDIGNCYPHLVGRVQDLFQVCDAHNIPRPTVLITEWGWGMASQDIPPVNVGLEHLAWASWFYAAYPEVLGAAIWYLGPGWGDVADQVQHYILPWRDYALSNYYAVEPGQGQIDPELFRPEGSGCTIPSVSP
jgi:uncharacterized repeat protein (TIGR01451 family)